MSTTVDHKTTSLPVALITDSAAGTGSKRKVRVLDEDQYVEQLERIVERDFFPDLQALRAQSLPPAAPVTETPSLAGFTNQLSYQETVRSEVLPSDKTEEMEKVPCLSLGKFLNKFTSEDNASFEVIMDDIHKREKEKYHWMFLDEKEGKDRQNEQLTLPAIEKQAISCGSTGSVLTWPFQNKNSVMYYPEGAAYSESEKQTMSQQKNSVSLENTRFTGHPFNEMEQRMAIQEASLAQSQACEGRIGPDGKFITAPKVSGYAIVPMTPTPARVLSDASPLMTWGEVAATPVRINSGTPFHVDAGTPNFRMPQTPVREELAHSLAESIAKKHRERRRRDADTARARSTVTGKSAQDQLCRMSPAAQMLATKKLGIKRSCDPKLLASYTPDLRSQSSSPFTPVLGKSHLTPGSSALTDNLLQLRNSNK